MRQVYRAVAWQSESLAPYRSAVTVPGMSAKEMAHRIIHMRRGGLEGMSLMEAVMGQLTCTKAYDSESQYAPVEILNENVAKLFNMV